MISAGMQLYRVFTKTEYKRGAIPVPGTRATAVDSNGASCEYIAVQLAGGQTLINGMAFTIAANGVATLGTANPSLLFGGRIGVLCLASATATSTTGGTSYGWCQIYGKALALVTASVTAIGGYLTMGADGRLIGVIAGNSASSVASGINAAATQAASGLLSVLLQYPKFDGYPA